MKTVASTRQCDKVAVSQSESESEAEAEARGSDLVQSVCSSYAIVNESNDD